jgi:hypothetical protein
MKNETLRVVLDEPRLYIEENLGTVMVRGEVIVNFSRDTPIQGPIELLFEGIQRYQTWPGNSSSLFYVDKNVIINNLIFHQKL